MLGLLQFGLVGFEPSISTGLVHFCKADLAGLRSKHHQLGEVSRAKLICLALGLICSAALTVQVGTCGAVQFSPELCPLAPEKGVALERVIASPLGLLRADAKQTESRFNIHGADSGIAMLSLRRCVNHQP